MSVTFYILISKWNIGVKSYWLKSVNPVGVTLKACDSDGSNSSGKRVIWRLKETSLHKLYSIKCVGLLALLWESAQLDQLTNKSSFQTALLTDWALKESWTHGYNERLSWRRAPFEPRGSSSSSKHNTVSTQTTKLIICCIFCLERIHIFGYLEMHQEREKIIVK